MVKALVLGATGKQGSATARALLSSGTHTVRALVRNASSEKAQALAAAGAELVEGGDWDKDVAGLDKAFAGIEAFFFISMSSPTDPHAELRGITNIIEAAQRAGTVRHAVFSSIVGVEGGKYRSFPGWDSSPFLASYWTSKDQGEALVKTSGFAHHTIIRPTEFMSNYTSTAPRRLQPRPDLATSGVWHTAFPGTFLLSLVDVDDIGQVAAAAINNPSAFAAELAVNGERVRVDALIAILGRAAGKELRFHTYTREEAVAAARLNPLVASQLVRLAGAEEVPVEHHGLRFRTFEEHVAVHRDEVVELYKDVP
ncbi:NAD(P)-binding protein [Hypoxylon sp. NC1633]|nr:NAD(P)-binding protein [Hypoxylon sp. NC1633]